MIELLSLRGVSWAELAKRTARKSWEDEVLGQSARLAFYFFFALFPALLLLLILLTMSASGPDARGALLHSFTKVLPPGASALLARTTEQLNARAVFGTGAVVAGLYSVWGALNGTWAMITGLNKAYEVEEERPWWRIVAVIVGLTISLTLLCLMALAAIVYGNQGGNIVGQHIGRRAHSEFLWQIVRWAFVTILLVFSLSLLYRLGPNLRDRRWQWSIPGAVIAAVLWIAFTQLLRVYEEHFSSSRIYGGLNAVATLLLWLYLTGAAIFIGGEANSEIEKTTADHSDSRRLGDQRSG